MAFSLPICPSTEFIKNQDISLCAQDLFLTGILFLLALVATTYYLCDRTWSSSTDDGFTELRQGLSSDVKNEELDSSSSAISENNSGWSMAALRYCTLLMVIIYAVLVAVGIVEQAPTPQKSF